MSTLVTSKGCSETASPQEMYGKTYKLHNSPGLAPAKAPFV